MARYAISDIHGCKKTFEKLLFDTLQLKTSDELFLLGDYIDRGPDSKGVIDLILQLKEDGYTVHCLLGNHEAMMLDALEDEKENDNSIWLQQGGKETLQSFGISNVAEVPEKYWRFIDELDLALKLDDYLLVHAGFNFSHPNIFSDVLAMLWIRNWYADIKPELLEGRTIVHGHTPTPQVMIERMNTKNPLIFLDIDAGCVYHKYPEFGHLCAFNMDEKTLFFEPYIDTDV